MHLTKFVALSLCCVPALLVLTGCPPGNLGLEKVGEGLKSPVFLTTPPNDASRLFVLEQNEGRVMLIENGRKQVFLDLGDKVFSSSLEMGLLGMAFHPDYENNGFFYLNYTTPGVNDTVFTVVERYQVTGNPDVADPNSAVVILTFQQPDLIHNAGMLAFGPDGYLYIAAGDGGPGNDPNNEAQSLDSLLGKILRIDVDSASPYAIPPDNPFVDEEGARPEIWAYGLRNPWRFSFDRETGDMYIGDVGERAREEINFEPAGGPGGVNYGWRNFEGSICRPGEEDCNLEGAALPVHEYEKFLTASVTGGYVYRGAAIPSLQGAYLFADWSTADIWSFRMNNGEVTDFQKRGPGLKPPVLLPTISSFGEDADGELYICSWLSGNIYKIIPNIN